MKIMMKTAVILLVALCLAGCKPDTNEQNPQLPTGATVDTIPTTAPTDPPVKKKEMTADQEYYNALGKTYMNTAKKSSEFYIYYQASDYVEAYPAYSKYLEPTGTVVYIFYRDGSPFRVAMVSFDSNGNVQEDPICRDMTKAPVVVDAGSAQDCYLMITECMTRYPDFAIFGITLDPGGFPVVTVVGKQAGDTAIKYVFTEPKAFRLVDPFETLEEGREAFKNYLVEREKIRAEVTIYPWVDTTLYWDGYIRMFEHSGLADTQEDGRHWYIGKYDSMTAVPLLSSKLEEDVYVLHLLYYHNQLIAEVVLECKYDGKDYTYSAVWENVAEKTADGKFIPLENSQYVSILKSAAAYNSDLSIQCVVYDDGKLIPVGMCEGKRMAFDSETNTIYAYK